MCNDYRNHIPKDALVDHFSELKIDLRFPAGVPNFEPRDDIKIRESAPIVTRSDAGVDLTMTTWAWKGPGGKPVFNFRSDGRSFARSTRCLIPTDGFYEFTDPQLGQRLKTKWLFTLAAQPWFWIAGIVKDGCFSMLTTQPGADIQPYHDRQIVVLEPRQAMEWLDLLQPETELLTPADRGTLNVVRVFPPDGPPPPSREGGLL